MEENKILPILTSEMKIPNENASVILGTVNKHYCGCFYINCGFWITIRDFKKNTYVKIADRDGFEDDSNSYVVKQFERGARHIIKHLIQDIHPQHKHHMISVNITESLNTLVSSGYCSFEITVILDDEIEFTKNEYLSSQVESFSKLLMDDVYQLERNFTITKKKPGFSKRGVPKGYKFPVDQKKFKPKKLKPIESHL